MQPIIDIQNLDFAYRQQLVLKQINLQLSPGRMLGVIGPNGAGKTTLIRLLLGLIAPTRGTILLDGLSPQRAVGRGDVVGYLPQNPHLPERFPLSVRQLVRLGLIGKTGLLRAIPRDDLDFAEQLIVRVGLAEVAEQSVSQLSGGQLQRALIARALAPRPKLLLLDEPTTGIDRTGQHAFVDFLTALRGEMNLTVVFVSHDLRTVTALCDRVACLNVTLHYHDTPQQMPAELIGELFGPQVLASDFVNLGGSST